MVLQEYLIIFCEIERKKKCFHKKCQEKKAPKTRGVHRSVRVRFVLNS